MTLDKQLARGDKIDFHVHLYAAELAIIDGVCAEYECSRAAVIAAWAREHAGEQAQRIPSGRRPGGGRKKKVARK